MKIEKEFVIDSLRRRFPNNDELVSRLMNLYIWYSESGLKDKKFDSEFTSDRDGSFYSYLWEMNLALHFSETGLKISSSDSGPDICIETDSKRVWVEAICPAPAGLPTSWLEASEEVRANSVPHEEMLLRWTSSIKEKNEKLVGKDIFSEDKNISKREMGYIEKGYVGLSDPYIVAISSCRLGLYESDMLYTGISQFPYAVEAAFPVGPLAVTINSKTFDVESTKHSNRWFIQKHNGSKVPTDNFLDPGYAGVSAVLGTYAGLNTACGCKAPIAVVHNPNARNPIPIGLLGANEEFVAEDRGDYFELRKI